MIAAPLESVGGFKKNFHFKNKIRCQKFKKNNRIRRWNGIPILNKIGMSQRHDSTQKHTYTIS